MSSDLENLLLEFHGLGGDKVKSTSRWFQFQKQYFDDPVAFTHDILGIKDLAFYQEDVLTRKSSRLAVRGPRGLGKTMMASVKLLHYALTRAGQDWKVPTTASSWMQVEKFLWPEIHKWAKKINWDRVGREPFSTSSELMKLSLRFGNGEAFGLASDQPERIEGAHADHLGFIYDESKAIPDQTFDAMEGAFSTPGDIWVLAISTPGVPAGRFYDIHSRKSGFEDWDVLHVTCDDAIRAGRLDPKWVEARQKQWGHDSALFQNHVLGEFASQDTDTIIPLSWVEAAIDRWRTISESEEGFGPLTLVSVDVGRGGDPSTFGLRHSEHLSAIEEEDARDVMQVTGKAIFLGGKDVKYVVDVNGVGAGVFDRLQEQGYETIPFMAQEGTDQTDSSQQLKFLNCRSLVWWRMRERLDPANDPVTALPNAPNLIGDLTTPKWSVTSSGKIQIESKERIRKRIGRSTDVGDVVVTAFYEDEDSGIDFY